MDWRAIDERLIRRGEILLNLDFLDSYEAELKAMNLDKIGRPYTLTGKYIEFLTVVRFLSCCVVACRALRIGIAFHPELTDDTRLHQHFLKTIKDIA